VGKILRDYWFAFFINVMMLIIGLSFYHRLPDRIPTHWNMYGQVDGWSTKTFGILFGPFLSFGLLLLFIAIPYIDPRRQNYLNFHGAYMLFVNGFMLFMAVVYVVTLLAGLGQPVAVDKIVALGVAGLFFLLGVTLGRVKSNFFIGVRTPWTLENPVVWDKTHRLAGYAFTAGGILIALSIFLPPVARFGVILGTAGVIAAITVVYSYFSFEAEKRKMGKW